MMVQSWSNMQCAIGCGATPTGWNLLGPLSFDRLDLYLGTIFFFFRKSDFKRFYGMPIFDVFLQNLKVAWNGSETLFWQNKKIVPRYVCVLTIAGGSSQIRQVGVALETQIPWKHTFTSWATPTWWIWLEPLAIVRTHTYLGTIFLFCQNNVSEPFQATFKFGRKTSNIGMP